MILYLDTSALVKLYVVEDGSEQIHDAASEAEALAVSRLAWIELIAAVARRGRESPDDQELLDQAKNAFAQDWPHFLVLEVNQQVLDLAGEYADAFALRAYDAVQLASAARLKDRVDSLQFACFDRRLNQAAGVLGLELLA